MRPNSALFPLLVFGTLLLGCGSGNQVETVPARGVLTVDGQPAAGATVIFVAQKVAENAQNERPSAETAADGTFTLSTVAPEDGAPAGEYKVLVKWPVPSDDPEASDADQLQFEYFNPDTTPLAITVPPEGSETLSIVIPPPQ